MRYLWVLLLAGALHADTLVVANRGGSTVTLIDPSTMTTLAQVDAGPQPHEVALSADGRHAYVSNYVSGGGNTLSVIDLATRTKIKTIDIGELRGPHGIAQHGGKIYFTAETSRSVASYDPVTDRVDWIGRTNQAVSHMLVLSPDGANVYTANIISATASIVPVGTAASRKNIPTVTRGEGIALSPDGKELWVGSVETGGIAIIDLESETRVATISVGQQAYRLAFTPNGRYVLATRGRALAIYDAVTREEIQRVNVTGLAFGILPSPDSTVAYVAVADPDQVVKVDLSTFQVLGAAPASPIPDGLALAVDPPARGPKRRSVRH